MSHNLQRSTHFDDSNTIRMDQARGLYNGFRNTFDEWETRKARAAEDDDDPDQVSPGSHLDDFGNPSTPDEEDDMERLRSRGGSFGAQTRRAG